MKRLWLARIAAALIAVLTVVLLVERLTYSVPRYDKWTDRDLVRAADFFRDLPTTGAELSYGSGGRIPGGVLYVLLGLPLWLGGDPDTAWRWAFALDVAGLTVLALTLRRHHGALAAAVAALMYVTDDLWIRTTIKLWNPTFLPLFVSLSIAGLYRLRADGEGRGLTGWLAALAVGAQVHLSAALWLVATLPSVVLARARGKGRGLGWGLVIAGLLFAPYVVGEVRGGFPNAHLLTHQPQVSNAQQMFGAHLPRTVSTLADLLGLVPHGGVSASTLVERVIPAWIAVAGMVLALAARRLGQTDGAALGARAVAGGVLLVLLDYTADGSLQLSQRYLLVLVPGMAALVGVAVGEAVRRAPSIVSAALVVLTLGLAWGRAAPSLQVGGGSPPSMTSWAGLKALLGSVGDALHQPLEGVAGRTVVMLAEGPDPLKVIWKSDTAVDYLLRQSGVVFPGSLPPPCAALITPTQAAPATSEALGQLLGPGVPAPSILRQTEIAPGYALVVYDLAAGPCPTSLSQRYVPTPVERVLHDHYNSLPTDHAIEVPAVGARRFLLAVHVSSGSAEEPDVRLAVAIDLVLDRGALTATLSSPHLRGDAYNAGWFDPGLVHAPTLRFRFSDGTEQAVPFSEGFVGYRSPIVPLTVKADLPPGPWSVSFEGDALPILRDHWPSADAPKTHFDVPLLPL